MGTTPDGATSRDLGDALETEQRGWDALCDGTGADVYGQLMTPDGVMVLASGDVMDRDTVVAALRQAPTWRRYEIREPRLIPAGRDAMVLVYVGAAWRDGDEPAFVGPMASVYVRTPDGLRLACYQQTAQP